MRAWMALGQIPWWGWCLIAYVAAQVFVVATIWWLAKNAPTEDEIWPE